MRGFRGNASVRCLSLNVNVNFGFGIATGGGGCNPISPPAGGEGATISRPPGWRRGLRSEEHTSELQCLMRLHSADLRLKQQRQTNPRPGVVHYHPGARYIARLPPPLPELLP